MRLSTILFLFSACLLCATPATSQPPKTVLVPPTLTARMEADEHEHSFTVRFLLRNNTDRDVEVEYGRGRSGLEVVPRFHLMDRSYRVINPPTYLGPARRSMRPDLLRIPARKEVLYGTFTMGYPRLRQGQEAEVEFEGVIRFRELELTLRTEPLRLKIPGPMDPGKPIISGRDQQQAGGSPGQWVQSENDDLAIRLSVKTPRIAATDNISLIAQIRNNTAGPLTILRPFGDPYDAASVFIKIWGKDGRIAYVGPEFDYVLDGTSFVTIGPGEIVTDTLELSNDHFAGIDQAGTYTLRYDYRYDGVWDETVAKEGVKNIWRGSICSREVKIRKE